MAPLRYLFFSLCFIGAQASSYYWPGKNGDILRTGFSEYGSISSSLAKGPAWRKLQHTLTRAPALIDDQKNIYITTIDGRIYKYSPDGEVLWKLNKRRTIEPFGAVFASVGYLYNGSMFVSFFDGESSAIWKVDMETGAIRWQTRAPVCGMDTWSLTVGEGIVFAGVCIDGDSNDHLIAISAETGDVLWTFKFIEPAYNTLHAVKDGSLVTSDQSGRAYRLNISTGKEIWVKEGINSTMSTGGTVMGPDGVVYTTSNDYGSVTQATPGWLTARAFEDGSELWRKNTEYSANNAAAVGPINGRLTVVIGIGNNPDVAIQRPWQPFMIPDNSSFLPPKPNQMVAYDAETGRELWKYMLPLWHGWGAGEAWSGERFCLTDCWANPAIAGDGTAYGANQDGNLYAIKDTNDDGKISADEVITYHSGHSSQGSTALAPGMVVQAFCNGLYVFKGSEDVGVTVFM